MRSRTPSLLIVAAALALASCSGSDAEPAASTQSSESTTVSATALDTERTVETQITRCMRNLGFEYELDVAAVARRAASSPGSDLDPYEYAATYGFGLTTDQGGESVESGTELESTSSNPAGETDFDDPNADYLADLGDDGQAAWATALWGDDDGDPGCYGAAVESVQATGANSDVDAELYAEAAKRAESDPDMIALRSQWGRCMSDRGFAYAQPVDIFDDLQHQLAGVKDAGALQQLQSLERETALASLDCNLSIDQQYQAIVSRYTS